MDNIEEDLDNKKIFDIPLLKRLLKYSIPYLSLMILALIILSLIMALELIKPIVIGKTIDKFISGYADTLAIFETKQFDSILFNDKYYIKDNNRYANVPKAKIVYFNDKYYLFNNLSDNEVKEVDKPEYLTTDKDELIYKSSGKTIKALLLSKNNLKILRKKDYSGIWKYAAVFLIVLLALFVLNYLQFIILSTTGQKIIYNLRNDLFEHIEKLSLSFFDKTPLGKLVTRVTNDAENLNEMYVSVIVNLGQNILLIIGVMIVMITINPLLALVTLSTIPPVFCATIVFRKLARENYRGIRKGISSLNSFLSEHLSGMKIIHILNLQQKKFEEFKKISGNLNQKQLKEIKYFAIFRPTMFIFSSFSLFFLLLFGGNEVISGKLSFGTLFIFFYYSQMIFGPIQQIAEQFNILQSAISSAERIFTLIDTKPSVCNPPNPIVIDKLKGDIEFKEVWFAYKNEDWVLKNVSFKINAGETVAFVGATGSGKTTILSLISRYYDIQKGQIFIDGYDIGSLDLSSLRKNIGMVMQDVFLFNGTIRSNIALKNPDISDEDIQRSIELANASKFINNLQNGLNSEVAEKGATFSSGERQLLSFARALAIKPSMFALDEATANIDTETERLIQDALAKMIKNKTGIIVAHRLSTIRHSDKIIVLHKGRVKEIGDHQSLLEKKDFYYNLYKLNYNC